MKNFNVKIIVSVFMLVLTTLACATPDISSLLNSMPSDNFSDSSSGWGTGTDANSSVEYLNDGLTFLVFTPFYISWSTPSMEVFENTHVEVSTSYQGSDPKGMFGFICNEQGSTSAFYFVGIAPDGYYAFIKSSVASDREYLKDGNSAAISASKGSLRLGLDCANGSMTLYANGQVVDSVSDSSYTSGSVGLFAASADQNSGTIVIFDDFAMTKLGQ